MFDINWGMLHTPDIGRSFTDGYRQGRQTSALATLGKDPANTSAMGALMEVNPDLAFRHQASSREQAEFERHTAARGVQTAYAQARYGVQPAGGQTGAPELPGRERAPGPTPYSVNTRPLSEIGSPAPTSGALSGVTSAPPMGMPGGVLTGMSAFSPRQLGGNSSVLAQYANTPVPMGEPPATPATDEAFARYLAADPASAMKTRQQETEDRSAQLKMTRDELQAHEAVNGVAISLLNGVRDQASWDSARAAASHIYQRYGFEMPALPAAYSPETVHQLQLQTMESKEIIAADLQERKFGWQQNDDRIDNSRADRSDARSERRAQAGEARAGRADRRAQVRFSERNLDRAAVAAGGGRIPNGTDDLYGGT